MPTYRYEGFTAGGKPKQGTLDAASEGDASARCRDAGLFLQKIEPVDGNPMKTVLHHRDEEFLELNDPDVLDQPRIHVPNEGQNYPAATAWQPSWRKPVPGVAKEVHDTKKMLEPWQAELSEEIHEIAEFYRGCLEVVNMPHSGTFPDILKDSLNSAVKGMVERAIAQAATGGQKQQQPSKNARLGGKVVKELQAVKKVKPSHRRS
jgi:hypothetical protein